MATDPIIRIRRVPGKWVVYALGNIYGETTEARELSIGEREPIILIPRDAVAMAFFDRTDHVSEEAQIGTATHYTLDTRSQMLENVAWSFESPAPEAAEIAGHLAFDTDRVTVERQ